MHGRAKTQINHRRPQLEIKMEHAEGKTPVVVSSQPHHAFLCFHALETHLSPDSPASTPHLASHFDALLADEAFPPCPLFVTWNVKRNPSRKDLRGCIGTFQAHPLVDGLKQFALTAALDDTRFPPVAARELSQLECSVSLLHAFEQAQSWDDWEVGTHGISIHFTHPKEDTRGSSRGTRRAAYSATFLPEVADEQQWDVLETIKHLIRKAGCHIEGDGDGCGRTDPGDDDVEALVFGRYWDGSSADHGVPLTQIIQTMRVERYQSSKCSASYTEYAAFVNVLREESTNEPTD
jgi:uncharacterized protein (TIGR00296 family)